MMKKFTLFVSIVILLFSASCTLMTKTMREPNVRVELNKADFEFSDQFSAEASSTKFAGIDIDRLFNQNIGNTEKTNSGINLSNIPVIGNMVSDRTSNYALYKLMQAHPGYDVIMYPQYEISIQKPIGIGALYSITKVKVTARLGKLKK